MRRLMFARSVGYSVLSTLLLTGILLGACSDDRNQKPTAKISASATLVGIGEQVTVDGSASADPDDDPLAFRWQLKVPDGSESQAALLDPKAEKTTFIADKAGDYTVSLIVDDGEFESATASVTITADVTRPKPDAGDAGDAENPGDVEEPGDAEEPDDPVDPAAPVADAGASDQTGAVGARVTLDASRTTSTVTDPEELFYSWRFVEKPPASRNSLAIEKGLTPHAWFVPDAEGTYKVLLEVRDGAFLSTDTVTISVIREASSVCLMISEFILGSGTNKAIELYNCGDTALDLNKVRMCIVSNENTQCAFDVRLVQEVDEAKGYKYFDSIEAGAVAKVCHTGVSLPAFDINDCDIIHGWLNNLNGDDRFFVYEDTDQNGGFSNVDLVVDAFGETAVQPSSTIWAKKTFRRCNFDLYSGVGPFDVSDYYSVHEQIDDFSDFGTRPTEGCASN